MGAGRLGVDHVQPGQQVLHDLFRRMAVRGGKEHNEQAPARRTDSMRCVIRKMRLGFPQNSIPTTRSRLLADSMPMQSSSNSWPRQNTARCDRMHTHSGDGGNQTEGERGAVPMETRTETWIGTRMKTRTGTLERFQWDAQLRARTKGWIDATETRPRMLRWRLG